MRKLTLGGDKDFENAHEIVSLPAVHQAVHELQDFDPDI